MRLWDTFMFRDELDMLECRLVQFEQYPVYKHVLVEAPVDHRGHPKPLVYMENRERFAPWANQIVHVVASELADIGGDTREAAWQREGAQRDAIGRGLQDADSSDVLILADLDEIPNAYAIEAALAPWQGLFVFEMMCCIFAVDWVWDQLRTSGVARVEDVTSFMQARREIWSGRPLPGSGHHLTWLGGVPGVQAKLDSTPHTEDVANIAATLVDEAFYRQGANPFGRHGYAGPLHPVDVDASWPKWIYERKCPPGWFRPR
jgi:hypothetical protein